ncbi:GNAT family N-acetyltransferase [Pseudomonas fluorescens]|uniref:GNAT family N-acetyltransferase n=1 Tax=Pseudomonas lactucae TaxID=2813360 RepID=A0A9X0YFX2_9PSED|nr:GNAT family N-acetyltransferase [Pseudomonas lactucae]OPA89113.1 GNAT family N-acetyltransferase [Pseudomonas fluorescens]MBN2978476.1 GNAT family N-acetyltransferase [Pseudomonas lactucae]MBN2985512.1 GNAT family N-acetyltransferase [Pseudomonas lactucae]OPB08680.1 GNAT family N-acetyltransferase [Pseudomonas fluorescens]OPB19634.1 GNAT family N-acetyltransferase [Pseudomonas fluorescens]
MTAPRIEISDQANPDAEHMLGSGLAAFNEDVTGYNDRLPLTVLLKDPETRQVIGGITGKTTLGTAFLDLFHLPDTLRGTGLGSRLLQAFEDEARRRGCLNAVLYTISFQAPGFYEKNGWVRFGEIPCAPEGSSRVFLSKRL